MVASLVDVAAPMFTRLAAAMRAMETMQVEGIEALGKSLDEGQKRVEAAMGVALRDFDENTLPLFEADKVARRRGRAPASSAPRSGAQDAVVRPARRSAAPRPVTRGVGTPPKSPKVP
jgi:hypothetical protein